MWGKLKWLPLCRRQELIRNKARNGQNCCLLEEAYAMVSSLPQRSESTHHVSLIENYPATLDNLGEPIRQVLFVLLLPGPAVPHQRSGVDCVCSVLTQGPFTVWEGAPGVRTSSRGHHRHVFLFKNYVLICKPKRDTNTDTQTYVFKNMMKVRLFCSRYFQGVGVFILAIQPKLCPLIY